MFLMGSNPLCVGLYHIVSLKCPFFDWGPNEHLLCVFIFSKPFIIVGLFSLKQFSRAAVSVLPLCCHGNSYDWLGSASQVTSCWESPREAFVLHKPTHTHTHTHGGGGINKSFTGRLWCFFCLEDMASAAGWSVWMEFSWLACVDGSVQRANRRTDSDWSTIIKNTHVAISRRVGG